MSVFLRLLGRLVAKAKDHSYRARIKRLVAEGLEIGENVTILPSVTIDHTYPYLIRIGNNCSLSSEVRVLAHDATSFKFTDGYTRLGKVTIEDNCFIGERAVILPGVTIGPNVLVAAGSVVNKDIPPNSCVAGVPARVYAKFDAFLDRQGEQLQEKPAFEYAELCSGASKMVKERIKDSVQDGNVYIRGYVGKYPYTWNTAK